MYPEYDYEREHEVVGTYPGPKGVGPGIPDTPKFYRPISPVENFRRFINHDEPCWMPLAGWWNADVQELRPRQHADNYANRQCIDGGPTIDWENIDVRQKGLFDVTFQYDLAIGGGTVCAGEEPLEEYDGWQDNIELPNWDEFDWDGFLEMNKDYCSTDKAIQLGIQLGLWERMMMLSGVEIAGIALMDEDEEEAVHELLDALADNHIDYIDRVSKLVRVDSVFMHDDWGTSHAAFFSEEIARKFFLKPLKKIIDFCHSKGIIYEHHSCGKAESLVEVWEDAGVDYWLPQTNVNDVEGLVEKCKDMHITFTVDAPFFRKGASEEEVRQQAKEFVEKWGRKGVLYQEGVDNHQYDDYDAALFPVFADAVYEYSRKLYMTI